MIGRSGSSAKGSRRRNPTAPRGFTLVELLVVIIVLALLAALLLPAINAARRTAQEAASIAEINSLSQALNDFKSQYGEFPPSRIILNERGDYSTNTGLETRTLAFFRKVFPRAVFSTSGTPVFPATATNGNFYDFNGDGVLATSSYILSGHQCLVFFLGGIPQHTNSGGVAGYGMTGFAKSPQNPFKNSDASSNRSQPLFEFNNSRLVADPANDHGIPGYVDSLPAGDITLPPPFYAYFSAYAGSGYDPDDYNIVSAGSFVAETDANNTNLIGAFMTNNFATNTAITGTNNVIASAPPNPYVNDVPVPTLGTGHLDKSIGKTRVWQNPSTFQIISPGFDRLYGIGGQYLSGKTNGSRVPWMSAVGPNTFQTVEANSDVTGVTLDMQVRQREADNLTNFSTGKLD